MRPPKHLEIFVMVLGLIALIFSSLKTNGNDLNSELFLLFIILNIISFDALHIYSTLLMPINSDTYRQWFFSKENIFVFASGIFVAIAGVSLFFYVKSGSYLLFGIYLLKLLIVQHLFKQSYGFSRLFTSRNSFEKAIIIVLMLLAPLMKFDDATTLFFNFPSKLVVLFGCALIFILLARSLFQSDFKKVVPYFKYLFHFLFFTSIWASIASRVLHGIESWRWNKALYEKEADFKRPLYIFNFGIFLLAALIYFLAQPNPIVGISNEYYPLYEFFRNFHVGLAFFHYWQDIWFFKSQSSPKKIIYTNLIEANGKS